MMLPFPRHWQIISNMAELKCLGKASDFLINKSISSFCWGWKSTRKQPGQGARNWGGTDVTPEPPVGCSTPAAEDFWDKIMQIKSARHTDTPEIVQGVQGLGFYPKTPIWDGAGLYFPKAAQSSTRMRFSAGCASSTNWSGDGSRAIIKVFWYFFLVTSSSVNFSILDRMEILDSQTHTHTEPYSLWCFVPAYLLFQPKQLRVNLSILLRVFYYFGRLDFSYSLKPLIFGKLTLYSRSYTWWNLALTCLCCPHENLSIFSKPQD